MNKKMILGLMATLTCLDATASSENSKVKMVAIAGATFAIVATGYKAWDYYKAQPVVNKPADNATDQSGQTATTENNNDNTTQVDTITENNNNNDSIVTKLEDDSAKNDLIVDNCNNEQNSSALQELHTLLLSVVQRQNDHEKRLTDSDSLQDRIVEELKDHSNRISAVELGKIIGFDGSSETSSVDGTQNSSPKKSTDYSGLNESTFNSGL